MDDIKRRSKNHNRDRILNEGLLGYLDYEIGVSERNKEIVKKYVYGSSYKELSQEYNVSKNRIASIVTDYILHVYKFKNE